MWHQNPPEHYALMTTHPIAQVLPPDRHVVGGRPRVSSLDGTKRLRLGLPTHDFSTRGGPIVLVSGHPAEVCVTRVVAATRTSSTPSLPLGYPWLHVLCQPQQVRTSWLPYIDPSRRPGGLFMTQLGLQIDPVQSCENCLGSCPELRHWRCRFVLNLTTLWRLRLLIRHAVETLCVGILQPDWINIVDAQHGELPTVNANVHADLPRRKWRKDGPGLLASTTRLPLNPYLACCLGLRPAISRLSHSLRQPGGALRVGLFDQL